MTDEQPSLDGLRDRLRESKALSANGQAMLDSPEGRDLIAEHEAFIRRANAQGRPDLARQAAESLANILEKTANLERAQGVSDAAERNAVQVILDVLGGSERR